MSVKCTMCDKSCYFRKEPFSADLAALLTRHNALVIEHAALLINNNALVEAVAWERECDEFLKSKTYSFFVAWEHLHAARAEVDRLITEGEVSDGR